MGNVNNMGAGSLVDIQSEKKIPTLRMEIQCHFLKIDVEGMELQVLQGASEMIKACMPIVYLENDRPDKSKQLIELLNSFGYTCFWHTPALFNPNNYFKNKNDVFGDIGSINMLCVPQGIKIQGLEEADPQVDWKDMWNTFQDRE